MWRLKHHHTIYMDCLQRSITTTFQVNPSLLIRKTFISRPFSIIMLLHYCTSPLLFSVFSLLLLLCSLVVAADVQYFINCGSSIDVNDRITGKTFIGDDKADGVHISRRGDKANQPEDKSDPLYQTARVFRKASSYDFNISQSGNYFVRLHFCAFSSELAGANFSVTASGLMLLPPFSPGIIPRNCSLTKPNEFILSIKNTEDKFRIYFIPTSSSLAFVNAIEVLSTKSKYSEKRDPYVSPAGSIGQYKNLNATVLESMYRVNVGGKEVEAPSDQLLRTWIPDDQYLINKGDARNTSDKSMSVDFNSTAGIYDAPSAVYGTAKETRYSKESSTFPNLTWRFNVSKGTTYFVRAHFCDIVSENPTPFNFTFYINSNFSQVINPHENTNQYSPFYKDYVAESGDLTYMNISVGPNNRSESKSYFFLNGLEIMQVKNETVLEPQISNNNNHLVLIVALVASMVALIAIMATILACLYMKKRKKPTEAFEWRDLPLYGATSSHQKSSESSSSHASAFQNLHLGLKIPFVEIQRVTNNFDANLMIGEGGFGKVYKGTLRSGVNVAVKRGSPDHGQGIEEFQTEILILSKIRHRHLVSLIGYCYENGEMILVYEFMEKGTLRYHLYDSVKGSTSSTKEYLSWKQRLEICIGAAKGIQYLHTGTNTGIIHRDVKSTNILLDEKFVAKVADFGLSRSGFLDKSQVSISDVKGTFGYLDPEYAMSLQLTDKSDVYAFGVVLLEVLCARTVIDTSLPREQVNLAEWAISCYEDDQIETVIDPFIASEINPKSLKKFCEIAERCIRKEAAERPPMSDVCWGLEYALQLQKSATDRALLDDSMTDASLNMPLPAIQRFPSQSLADSEYFEESFKTEIGKYSIS